MGLVSAISGVVFFHSEISGCGRNRRGEPVLSARALCAGCQPDSRLFVGECAAIASSGHQEKVLHVDM